MGYYCAPRFYPRPVTHHSLADNIFLVLQIIRARYRTPIFWHLIWQFDRDSERFKREVVFYKKNPQSSAIQSGILRNQRNGSSVTRSELHATRAVLARVIWLFLTAVLHLHAFVRLFNMDGLLYNDHCSCSICIASVFFRKLVNMEFLEYITAIYWI